MGLLSYFTDSVVDSIEKTKRRHVLEAQMLEMRTKKKERDYMIASRIATTRERVWWLAAFYGVMGAASFGRMIVLRKIAPLPLDFIPFALVPFLFAYQFDFAYLDKANRIDKITQEVLTDDSFWFNQPLQLSTRESRDACERMYNYLNDERRKLGLPEERRWCH